MEARLQSNPSLAKGDAISTILLKVSRRKRAYHNYRRFHKLEQRKLEPEVKEWLAMMIKQLQAGLPNMKGRTTTDKVQSIANWKKIEEQGLVIMRPLLLKTLVTAGNSVMSQRILKQDRFDVIGTEAVAWTTQHSAELVVEITNETMAAIRTYIEVGINAGKSIQAIAMELRPLVGLTERQIMAVANYHEMLILERPEYTAATQREMADTYARRLHRRRATTIARTETAEALTEGQRQGYGQMGIKQLMRIEDPAAVDEPCAYNNGTIYSLAAASGVLPEHPNCEGSWVAAP